MTTTALQLPQLSTLAQPDVTVNDALAIADAALGGEIAIVVEADDNVEIGTAGVPSPWQYAVISVVDDGSPGILTGSVDVLWPDVPRRGFFLFANDTAETLTLKRIGQSGVAVPSGNVALVRDDGTDIVAPNTSYAPGSDELINESGVAGSTVSDALDNLSASIEDGDTAAIAVARRLSGERTVSGATGSVQTSDAGGLIRCTSGSATTITVDPDAMTALPDHTIVYVEQAGAGQVTIAAGSGVTIDTSETLLTAKQYAVVALIKRATDHWRLTGEREVSA